MSVIHTTCRFCLVRCGMKVEVEDGEVKKVTGDTSHPMSKGYLCVKGKASIDMTFSPRRVIYPQKRVGERGSGQWRRVSWDEALGDIAERLNAIRTEHGPNAIAVQALPPKEYFAYDIFLAALGSTTFFKHDSHQCFTPQLMADVLTYGGLLTYPAYTSVLGSDVILLWGINPSETNGSKHQRVRDAQRHGAKTIVVDPRPTLSAKEAAVWLRVRPGTDAALALGFIREMIVNGWIDEAFLARWTVGFDALKERALGYTPERVSKICWVPEENIREAAKLFGEADNAALYTFIGATMGGNSVATLRLLGFIPALKGKFDQPGNNGFLPATGVRMPSYFGANLGMEETRDFSVQLSAGKFPLLAGPDAITTPYPHPRQVIDAIMTDKPYPVRALWTDCNPVVGLEDSAATIEALKKLDLLVVSDLFESPTASLADYILPVTTHLESNAISEYSGVNMIAARTRVMAPRGEARDEGDPVLEVAVRMGLANKLPVSNYEELLDYRLEPLGMTFAEFSAAGIFERANEPAKHEKGKIRKDGKPGFNTASGKIEFASAKLAAFGYDPLPDFVEPPDSPYSAPQLAEDYPLVLISGTRSIEYYSTMGIEIPRLRSRRPWPTLEMSPLTAACFGLEEGDWVSVETPNSPRAIKRQVALMAGMDERVVNAEGLWYMPGCEDLIEGVLEANSNVLTPLRDDVDPVCGGSVARCLICRIAKCEPPEAARRDHAA